jgi:hypothetical protein
MFDSVLNELEGLTFTTAEFIKGLRRCHPSKWQAVTTNMELEGKEAVLTTPLTPRSANNSLVEETVDRLSLFRGLCPPKDGAIL